MLEIIPIAKLQPSLGNPRRQVGDVRDLVASISALGVLEPLMSSPNLTVGTRLSPGTDAWPLPARLA